MSEFRVRKAHPIATEITVPGDKSISHRAIMFASLANGTSEITGFLPSGDCLSTAAAFRAMGVEIAFFREDGSPWQPTPAGEGPHRVVVHGRGLRLHAPTGPVDCGNSGTTMRLLSGILAGLIPTPRLHFLMTGCAPGVPAPPSALCRGPGPD